MNATEKARRADALYHDHRGGARRLCEMVVNREDDIEQLKELASEMFRDMVNMDCELRRHGRTFLILTRYEHRLRELGVIK